jgi:hypothetical protein
MTGIQVGETFKQRKKEGRKEGRKLRSYKLNQITYANNI